MYGAPVDTTPDKLARICARLQALRTEQCALEAAISGLAANPEDELELKRLQHRRLQLLACIALLENLLIPDEPA